MKVREVCLHTQKPLLIGDRGKETGADCQIQKNADGAEGRQKEPHLMTHGSEAQKAAPAQEGLIYARYVAVKVMMTREGPRRSVRGPLMRRHAAQGLGLPHGDGRERPDGAHRQLYHQRLPRASQKRHQQGTPRPDHGHAPWRLCAIEGSVLREERSGKKRARRAATIFGNYRAHETGSERVPGDLLSSCGGNCQENAPIWKFVAWKGNGGVRGTREKIQPADGAVRVRDLNSTKLQLQLQQKTQKRNHVFCIKFWF